MSMSSNDFEIVIEDPTTGVRHSFSGATEDEALAAAADHFGVAQAEAMEQQS